MVSFNCLNKCIIIAMKFLLKIASRPTQRKFLLATLLPEYGSHVPGFFSSTSTVFVVVVSNKTAYY